MKFNWGTGIFIFLTLFLIAAAAFIIFAFSQDVNLVHKDYYEKGVDYSDQMNVSERSELYNAFFQIRQEDDFLILQFNQELSFEIDSGKILFYRPSNSKHDLRLELEPRDSLVIVPKSDLIPGRYIVKLYWYSGGLKYEIDKPVNIH